MKPLDSSAVFLCTMITIIKASTNQHYQVARILFKEYAASLEFDLDFQDFESELEHMQDLYGPPSGCLLLVSENNKMLGCVALRKLDKKICEMKRLYVNPKYRRQDFGRMLAQQIIEEAKLIGYSQMRLDTVPSMKSARSLYRSLGFTEIEPYRYNPIKGTSFMELLLR